MIKTPKLYEATGKSAASKTIVWLKIGLVVLVLCICAFFVSIFENKILLLIDQIVAISVLNLVVVFNSNPRLKIYPLSDKISYIHGFKNHVVCPGNFESLNLENDIFIQTKNKKRIKIKLAEFPNIEIQKLKDNFGAIFIENKPIKDVFLSNPVEGFNVVNKTILETPNPWPRVLFIFSCCAVVVYLFYLIINS